MKITILIGVLLLVIGVVSLGYQGISYTTKEKVVDLGPLEATAEREKTIPLPPVVGGLSLAGGAILIVLGMRKPR